MIRGEDEDAIKVLAQMYENYEIPLTGMDGSSIRSFVESARDPFGGKDFIAAAVAEMQANASDFATATVANFWYLAFGYLEEYVDAIESMHVEGNVWTNSDVLEQAGRFYKASSYLSNPRVASWRDESGQSELYEQRGPPDDCSKVDGDWVCH